MEEFLFRSFIDECSVVSETTSYVEIFNYAVSGQLNCALEGWTLLTKRYGFRIPRSIRASSMRWRMMSLTTS